jgi:hypothetical protein
MAAWRGPLIGPLCSGAEPSENPGTVRGDGEDLDIRVRHGRVPRSRSPGGLWSTTVTGRVVAPTNRNDCGHGPLAPDGRADQKDRGRGGGEDPALISPWLSACALPDAALRDELVEKTREEFQ